MHEVINRYHGAPEPGDVWIGRPSALGNPFTHLNGPTYAAVRVETREDAVLAYAQWLWHRLMIVRDPVVIAALRAIPPGSRLVCVCAPALCHGEVLAHALDWLARHGWPEPAAGYVITKATRLPDRVSYTGPAWDTAGLRHVRQDVYTDYALAVRHAQALTDVNPAGFQVGPVD